MHKKQAYKIILFLLFICYNGLAKDMPISEIRKKIEQATLDEDVTIQLIKDLEAIEHPKALHTAFLASANGIMCTHINNPIKQMKYAKKAVKLADQAVAMDENNLEVRFIRFAIESNIPKVMGLSKHVEHDKSYLLSHFNKQHFKDIPYRSLEEMIHVLEESERFTSKEMIKMKAEVYG